MNRISVRDIKADLPKNLLKKKMDEIRNKEFLNPDAFTAQLKFIDFKKDFTEMIKTDGLITVENDGRVYDVIDYHIKKDSIILVSTNKYIKSRSVLVIRPEDFETSDITINIKERKITTR